MIKVNVECDPLLKSPDKKNVLDLVTLTLENFKYKDSDISIIFSKDELLTELKKEFFQKDQLTDVIAFRLNEYDLKEIEGEIYISLPRAKENSKLYSEKYEQEVSRLIIHGCLHLMGYDDDTKQKKLKMTELENKMLKIFKNKNIFEG